MGNIYFKKAKFYFNCKSGWASFCFVVLLSFSAFPIFSQETNYNAEIVHFCREHLGQAVGDGECFALVAHAFREAGLKRSSEQTPNKGDFVWGTLIVCIEGNGSEPKIEGQVAKISAGDIIQFRDADFKIKKRAEHFGHHTAVIEAVSNNGSDVRLLQQHYAGQKIVTELDLHLPALKSGWIRIYQPTQPIKEANNKKS